MVLPLIFGNTQMEDQAAKSDDIVNYCEIFFQICVFCVCHTVDGFQIRWLHQLRLVVFPIIYRVSYIPGGCLGFQPSTVTLDFVILINWCLSGAFARDQLRQLKTCQLQAGRKKNKQTSCLWESSQEFVSPMWLTLFFDTQLKIGKKAQPIHNRSLLGLDFQCIFLLPRFSQPPH